MKKWMITLLCLLMLIPMNAYADDTESQPAESQSSESQPAESQPSESQPTESQPAESQPSESQPTESQPSESQPTESQPSESQPTESQPAETVPSDHAHTWDVSYTVPATCLEEGATAYGCSACGAISVEVLPKLTTHTYDNACDPHCNVCDISREVPHKYSISTVWSKNSSGHWHACSACGAQEDFGKHYPGPAATEEKAQICLTCGYTLTAKLGHSHKYETQWSSDETGHWYACSGCDDQKNAEDHIYDDACDSNCNVCGYVTGTAHSYSGTWYSDAEGHWDVCTVCQEQGAAEPHIPGPEPTDTQAQLCVACGFELAPAPVPTEHLHTGEGNWLKDAQSHWKLCACGEIAEPQSHVWDEGQEQEESTIRYTCKDCGFTRTEKAQRDGISPLVWIGVTLVALLGAGGVVAFLLLRKPRKGGKYSK